MHRHGALLAALFAALALAGGARGEAPKFGRHEVWAQARDAADAAAKAGELDAASRELVAAFAEAVRFAEGDPRLEQTQKSLDEIARKLEERGDPKPLEALFARVGELADAAGAPATSVSVAMLLRRSALASARDDPAAAEQLARAAREKAEARFGPSHATTLGASAALNEAVAARDPRRAIPLAEAHVALLRDALGPESEQVVGAQVALAQIQLRAGQPERARDVALEALAAVESKRALSGAKAGAQFALALIASALGDYDAAEESARAARGAFELGLGPSSRAVAQLDGVIANAHFARGDLQRAFDVLGATRARIEADAGERSPRLVGVLAFEARLRIEQGELDEAERALARAIALGEAAGELGADETLAARWTLADLRSRRGSVAESERIHAELLARPAPTFEAQLRRCAADNQLAYAYTRVQRFRDALPVARRALACSQQLIPPDDPSHANMLDTLGWAQLGAGDAEAAARSFATVLRMLEARPQDVFAQREIWSHVAELERRRGDAPALARAQAELERLGGEIRLEVVRRGGAAGDADDDDVNEAGNYRFAAPEGWRRFESERVSGSASAWARREPAGFLTIAANDAPDGAPPLDAVADSVADGVSRSVAGAKLLRRESHDVNGMRGIRLVMRAQQDAQPTAFVVWLTRQAGAFFQLTFWAPASAGRAAELLADADAVFAGFSLLDPSRGSERALRELRSERFGYRVKLHGDAWHAWEDMAEDAPHAERGALFGSDAALAVAPVALAGMALDLDTIAPGLDNLISQADFASGTPVRVDGVAGREIEFSRKSDGQRFWYRMRAFARGGAAYLVAVWTRSGDADDRARAFEAIEGFSFEGEPELPDVEALAGAERARHALFFNDAGITALGRGQPDAAVALLDLSVRLDGGGARPLRNLAYAMLEAGRPRDLLARLAPLEERVLADPELRASRARARELVGETEGAIADYGAAIAGGADDDALDQRYVELLLAADRGAEARAHVDARVAKSGSVALRRVRAGVLRETGDAQEAARELLALRKLRPADGEILFELAETQRALGDHAAVIETCDAILKGGPSSYAHYLKAHAQTERLDYAGAKRSIEAALQIEPDSEEAKSFLAHVSAMLGEGENSALKQALEPVALPDDLRAWMEAGARVAPAAEHETRNLWRVKGVHFVRGQELRTTLWLKVDVRDRRSIEQLSRLEFDFHPLWEKIYVNSLVVRDATGRELGRGRASDAYVLDPLQDEQATSKRRLYVPVRGLAVGATLELVLTRLEAGGPERFSFLDETLSLGVPIERSALFVTGDVGSLASRASPGLRETRGDARLEWRVERPPVDRWEPLQPAHKSYLPAVRVADARDSWSALARDYQADLREFEKPDAGLAELAREQTRGLSSPDEKARALALFVQRTLSYQAIEFGRHARIPNPAAEVLDKKFGDCKDHALLLHQLLIGAGVRSRLALASFGTKIEPALPSIDQFDHMIVRCLDCREARWLDATDKGLRVGSEAPRGLAGNAILVLDGEQARLETIPAAGAAPHLVASERSVKLAADGSLSVDERISFDGYPAAWVRDFLRGSDRSDWKDAMRNVLLAEHDIVRSVEVENLERTSEPLALRLGYDVRSAFSRAGSGWVGRAPIAWEEQLLNLARVEKRETPVEFATPFRFRSALRIEPPDGFALRAAPLGPAERGGGFTRLRGELARDGRALVLRFEIDRSAAAGPASRYAELDRENGEVFEYLRQSLELERAP